MISSESGYVPSFSDCNKARGTRSSVGTGISRAEKHDSTMQTVENRSASLAKVIVAWSPEQWFDLQELDSPTGIICSFNLGVAVGASGGFGGVKKPASCRLRGLSDQ
jgi:hypothetical protein